MLLRGLLARLREQPIDFAIDCLELHGVACRLGLCTCSLELAQVIRRRDTSQVSRPS